MILRVCVVITCSDHPRTISEVLKDVAIETRFPILVIDDGSETPVLNVLYSFEVKQALEQGRLRVLRFEQRRGAGRALEAATADLVSRGFTHMLTLAPDGTFKARDSAQLLELTCTHPWDLVIGRRRFKQITPASRWKTWLSRLAGQAVRFETGARVADPRSLYRVYPLYALQNVRLRTDDQDSDLEVLLRMLWRGVKIHETDVDARVVESEPETRPWSARLKDRARFSFFNLALICVAVLRTHARPGQLAIAMAVGVFVGCTPAFGFHTFIMLALASVLPLNFVAMWIGNHVSTPVLFPLMVMAEVYIGQHWLGIASSPGMMGHFLQWAAGSVVLGILLSVPAGLLTYVFARALQQPPRSTRFLDLGSRVLSAGLVAGGRRFAERLVPLVAGARTLFCRRARAGLKEYQVRVGLRGLYSHIRLLTRIELEELALVSTRISDHPRVRLEGVPSAADARVITANIGSWAPARQTKLNTAPALFVDERTTEHLELISFLGGLGVFDVSAFTTALNERRPVVFGFGLWHAPGVFDLHVSLAREYRLAADENSALARLEWAGRFVRQLEHVVRRHPEQWFNVYPFWSTRPITSTRGVLIEDLETKPRVLNRTDLTP